MGALTNCPKSHSPDLPICQEFDIFFLNQCFLSLFYLKLHSFKAKISNTASPRGTYLRSLSCEERNRRKKPSTCWDLNPWPHGEPRGCWSKYSFELIKMSKINYLVTFFSFLVDFSRGEEEDSGKVWTQVVGIQSQCSNNWATITAVTNVLS